MTLSVRQNKLHHTSQLLSHWLSSPRVSKSDLQSVIGKLSYVCACISPRKIFIQRILQELRRLPHKFTSLTPSPELLADLSWWDKFLSFYNGVSLLHSFPWIDNEYRFCTDACLSGVGGFFDGRFSHSAYPPFIDPSSLTIASLETSAVTVSVKLWSEELWGQRILVRTENQNTELAINTGRSRVPFVQSCLRELWFYASLFDFELRALHIPGHETLSPILWAGGIQILIFVLSFVTLLLFIMITYQSTFVPLICFASSASGNHLFLVFSGFHLSELQNHVSHIQAFALSDATKRNYHSIWNSHLLAII